eukprot:6191485-Pleurochrysis_carterae.AAC.2
MAHLCAPHRLFPRRQSKTATSFKVRRQLADPSAGTTGRLPTPKKSRARESCRAPVHLPSKPERSRWHLPTVWAPESATMSLSVKPLGWKISRRWSMPLSPSGSRPTCSVAMVSFSTVMMVM